ncbi:hypothetical protein THAOC_18726, partial [Thalassiosira oceanica]
MASSTPRDVPPLPGGTTVRCYGGDAASGGSLRFTLRVPGAGVGGGGGDAGPASPPPAVRKLVFASSGTAGGGGGEASSPPTLLCAVAGRSTVVLFDLGRGVASQTVDVREGSGDGGKGKKSKKKSKKEAGAEVADASSSPGRLDVLVRLPDADGGGPGKCRLTARFDLPDELLLADGAEGGGGGDADRDGISPLLWDGSRLVASSGRRVLVMSQRGGEDGTAPAIEAEELLEADAGAGPTTSLDARGADLVAFSGGSGTASVFSLGGGAREDGGGGRRAKARPAPCHGADRRVGRDEGVARLGRPRAAPRRIVRREGGGRSSSSSGTPGAPPARP